MRSSRPVSNRFPKILRCPTPRDLRPAIDRRGKAEQETELIGPILTGIAFRGMILPFWVVYRHMGKATKTAARARGDDRQQDADAQRISRWYDRNREEVSQ